MARVIESEIAFDFDISSSVRKIDAECRNWQSIDFIIADSNSSIWLEIKNFSPSSIPPKLRGAMTWSFLSKMRGNRFFSEVLRGKLLGTVGYLALKNQFVLQPISFVILVESPRLDAAMLLHATLKMQQLINSQDFPEVSVVFMNVTVWNQTYPQHTARVL